MGSYNVSWKYPIYHGGIRLWQVALTIRNADKALFLNNYDLEYAVKHLRLQSKKAVRVANGLSSEFLNLKFSSRDINSSTIRIASIGRFTSQKGIHYGCPALNEALLKHRNVEVSFLGTGSSQQEVLDHFDIKVHPRITVMSKYRHETLPSILKDHQIMFFPTLSEGFGMALIEAMAAGLAPITTYTNGPREIVEHEKNGLLVPVRDSLALARALERLITQPKLLAKLRHSAYLTSQKYSWNAIAKQTMEIYNQLGSKA
jgi:glycosyltransferase involved in cell wall biosynthesis